MMRYSHRQSARVVLWIIVPCILIGFGVACSVPDARWPMAGLVAVLAVSAWQFSSLTVEVSDTDLRWRFGPGWIRKGVALSDIERVEAVETRVIEGWGIHLTSRGWLYNVSGFGAVSVRMKNGKQFVLGSDEPAKLLAAIELARKA
jgi:hypothetical protein